jgi:hypothetical protein
MVMCFKISLQLLLITLLLVFVSGCGGGGGSSSGNNPPPVMVSTNADLSELSLSATPLDQTFQASQLSYTALVPFLSHATTVRPTADDTGAIITVNGAAVASGSASELIALSEGLNNITVLVTAEDNTTKNTYTVEVIRQAANEYVQGYLKAHNAEGGDGFGSSIALSGDTLVVGAPGKSIFGTHPLLGPGSEPLDLIHAGAAYVFIFSNGIWTQQAYLRASNADGGDGFSGGGDFFGSSVALSGNTLAVGAPGEDSTATGSEADNSTRDAGAVYTFIRTNGVWGQEAYLKATNAGETEYFGSSVAISGDTLAVGAPREGGSATGGGDDSAPKAGAVYVFVRTNGLWDQATYLKASNTLSYDNFGDSVALSGDTLVVGATNQGWTPVSDEFGGYFAGPGAAYVFTRTEGVWDEEAYLVASNAEGGDSFGGSVALSGGTLVVGANNEGSSADGGETDNSAPGAGAAYVFARSDTTWTQQAYLKASNAEKNDEFGGGVALSGDTLVVGAAIQGWTPADELGGYYPGQGAAYVFAESGTTWAQQAYLKAPNAEDNDAFGSSVALSGDTLAVGAPGENSTATGSESANTKNSGAVYTFP